jgi:hypothetical protein
MSAEYHSELWWERHPETTRCTAWYDEEWRCQAVATVSDRCGHHVASKLGRKISRALPRGRAE